MTALVRHLHAFAREVRLNEEEWAAAMGWLAAAGRISDDKRQEFILASDVLGLSTLVVQLNNTFADQATPATVLGPFHIDGSPAAEYGFDMSEGVAGTPLFITGTVRDTEGKPIPGAVLDVWQADADGNYESQIPEIDISHFRPAHVHFLLDEPGYRKLITHLFQAGADYLDSDVVFGTKDALIVSFDDRPAGPTPDGGELDRPYLQAEYDFVLQPVD
jgi:hydroxyquinol 1,2-dioxygenase